MTLFKCDSCGQTVHFESVQCTNCSHTLAFLPDQATVAAIEPDTSGRTDSGIWRLVVDTAASGARFRLCRNSIEHGVCNWAVPNEDPNDYCRSCRLNHIVPNLVDATAKENWHRIEIAKRRLLFTLLGLGLPVQTKAENPATGLAFDFLKAGEQSQVFTGHNDGLITLNIAEADNPFREKVREQLGEAYRTLLGHLRHESGHYFWELLVKDSANLEGFRRLFGDETLSYDEALKKHYEMGPPPNWWDRFVSSYATMHPWEDWAETWAHYLHMVDGLETAKAFGLSLVAVAGTRGDGKLNARRIDRHSFDDLIQGWVPLTVALNSMNRSFGMADCYPFVLTAAAIEKLRFVHEVVEQGAGAVPARASGRKQAATG